MKINKVLYLSDSTNYNMELMYLIDKLGYDLIHSLEYKNFFTIYSDLKPEIILIDKGFLDREIKEFIEFVKSIDPNAPVIILYDIKSDLSNYINLHFIKEYLSKDIFLKEFKSIEKSIFKKYEFENGISYNIDTKSFFKGDSIIKLNKQEASLIEFLLKEPENYHRYITIQTALSAIKEISIDTLRTIVKNIRKKTYSNIISNMSGHGYKINLSSNEKIQNNDINILICDDQKSNIEYLNTLLSKYIKNINIYRANGGKEAIEILKNNEINIILLDIHMPDINGWEVARFINKKLSDKNIATIFITSVYIDEEFQKEGFELGAVDYIIKPIDHNLLINRLNLYIKSFNQERKILKEIEKSRQKEKELLQKEVLVAQSNVLEKMAHHWRQPLSLISSNASLISFGLDSDMPKEKLQESLDSINSTTQNLSDLIEQFQSFFKPRSHKESLNLKKVIHSVIMLMRFSFIHNKIKLKLKLENIELLAYENELKQVLISLISNAIDVLISRDIEERFIQIELKEENSIVSISILDNAGGVDKDIQEKIYEPYFTTKHEYVGTGLSLHFSKLIAQRYLNGSLNNKNIKYTFKGKDYQCAKFVVNMIRE